jgi:queuosine precursor transporter
MRQPLRIPLSAIKTRSSGKQPGQVAATLQKRASLMTRAHLPGILAMAIIVLASNILVQFLFGNWLTWGAFTYPFAFLVTDIMNRVYGAGPARTVVLVGFIVGVFCSLVGTQIMGEYGPLVTFRIAIGSGLAFLTAQLLDVGIFAALRRGVWWKAPLVSTVISSMVDTALFFSIAFSASLTFLEQGNDVSWAGEVLPILGVGPLAPLWVSLAVADWAVKLTIALIALAPFRWVTARATSATEIR